MITQRDAISLLNEFGKNGTPFSFYCDFLGENWEIAALEKGNTSDFKLSISSTNGEQSTVDSRQLTVGKNPVSFPDFKKAFDQVVHEINIGNSFLTNLTFQTPIDIDSSLEEIIELSSARYKLYVPDQFVVFSPETFIKTRNDWIYSYPMKGTIDATLKNAEEIILNDPKETAEHITIVDLIRNDLSQVASEVSVSKFRYVEEIRTREKNLLQVSSEVKGKLPDQWQEKLGEILTKLIPAGSISGAPKPETLSIIQRVENYNRGFYTGICGVFDGENLDTGVMIRFIKKENDQLFYCSGGGITSFSDPEKEYQEMIDKVYLPV